MWFYRLYSCKIKYFLHREPREHVLTAIDAIHPVWQGLKDTCWATILYMVSIDRHVVLSLQKYNSQHSHADM